MNPKNRKWKVIASYFYFFAIVSAVLLQIDSREGFAAMGFGTGGIVITPIGSVNNIANALSKQSDGKLVAAGYASIGTPICTTIGPTPPPIGPPPPVICETPSVFALARYNWDGSLDTSFGIGGIVTTPIGTIDDEAKALAIQYDGKIVAAGFSKTGPLANPVNVFSLVRYNIDGSLDATFGSGGIVTTAIESLGDQANALAIQYDGKIVAAGYASIGTYGNSPSQFALVRYNSDGSLDTTFGTGGIVTTPVGASNTYPQIYALAIQSDGKFVAAGGNGFDISLARYNWNGSLDMTFGTGGIVNTSISIFNYAKALVIQPDGKLIAAGYTTGNGSSEFALVRYYRDGSLDKTFGSGGIVTTPIGSFGNQANALAIQSDGKLVAAGFYLNANIQYEIALTRYNWDGGLDPTFGTGGIVTTTIGGINDQLYALAIQTDGKIVGAGYSTETTGQSIFALARYNWTGSLDTK